MTKSPYPRYVSPHQALAGFTKLRVIAALSLVIGATLILLAHAANPANATINPTDITPVNWVGDIPGGSSAGGEATCVDGTNCDVFVITAGGTAADWSQKLIALNFSWGIPASDFDFFIHKDSVTGPIVGTGRNDGAPATDDNAAIDPQATGVGAYYVHIVYFTATNADPYHGTE